MLLLYELTAREHERYIDLLGIDVSAQDALARITRERADGTNRSASPEPVYAPALSGLDFWQESAEQTTSSSLAPTTSHETLSKSVTAVLSLPKPAQPTEAEIQDYITRLSDLPDKCGASAIDEDVRNAYRLQLKGQAKASDNGPSNLERLIGLFIDCYEAKLVRQESLAGQCHHIDLYAEGGGVSRATVRAASPRGAAAETAEGVPPDRSHIVRQLDDDRKHLVSSALLRELTISWPLTV